MDLAALVILAAISGLCFQGLYRLVFGSSRRVILPPTEANLPEYETETLRVRRERSSGRRADRSNVSIPSQGLGEGNEILGKGINEAVVNDAGVSAFNDRLKRASKK